MSIWHADHCSKEIAYGPNINSLQPTKSLAATFMWHYEVYGKSIFFCVLSLWYLFTCFVRRHLDKANNCFFGIRI